MDRSAEALTVVWVVLLVLLAALPSVVPVEDSRALLAGLFPLAPAAPTVTWTVNTAVPLGASVTLRLQDRKSVVEGKRADEARGRKVVTAGRVADTPIPPTCGEGPWLVTVGV